MAKQKFKFAVDSTNEITSTKILKEPPVENETTTEVRRIVQQLSEERKNNNIGDYKIVPRHKLRSNKKNKFPLSSLDTLKETVLRYGLQQDITAIYVTDEDMYVVETGHRRKTV